MLRLLTVCLGLLPVLPAVAFAQSDTLRMPSMQEVYKQNSWLSGSNPVGLAFNHFNSFSVAEVGYGYNNGNLGKVSLPASADIYSVSGESFQTLGKVALYGRLAYVQNESRGQNWNGMLNDYWQGVNLCDSVSGKLHREMYHLAGAFSLPLQTRWLVGAKIDYRVQMMSKDTDPRNKNEWSEWMLVPGVGYQSGNYTIGASVLYADRKETVDYLNMGTHTVYPIFAEYPLCFFHTLPGNGNVKWYYDSREVGGALQMDVEWADCRLFQQLNGSIVKQNIESSRIQDCREGETDFWKAEYMGRLRKSSSCVQHEWTLFMSCQRASNYEPLQQQAESGVWRTYGKVLRSTRQDAGVELNYEYRQLRDAWHPRFSVFSGISYLYRESTLSFYPAEYMQTLHKFALHASFIRNFVLPGACLDCSVEGKYRVGSGAVLRERQLAASPNTEELSLWQNAERLQQDYDYETASRLGVNFSFTYTRKAPLRWFVRIVGGYEYSGKCKMIQNNKKIITSVGFVF